MTRVTGTRVRFAGFGLVGREERDWLVRLLPSAVLVFVWLRWIA